MKVILNYFNVQCAHCGSGIRGEKAWLEAPAIVVECPNPDCAESGKQYRLPVNKVELEPFEMPNGSPT